MLILAAPTALRPNVLRHPLHHARFAPCSLLPRRSMATVVASASGHKAPHQQQPPVAALEPLLAFPWARAVDRLCWRLLDLAWASIKLLTVPALLGSSASELQYALLHGKALVVPVAMLLGVVLAGVMNETIVELQPPEQWGVFHLIVMGLLFGLVKIPGPAYPSWGKFILPHFANGGLWHTCYLAWQNRP